MSLSYLITEIQRFSIHDGPGIRTTVFLKGCPLHCAWCHNPEAISYDMQILSYPEKCIGCGRCDEGCFSGAKVVCGKSMSTDEVLSEVLQDKPYYGEDGGLTLSGGEPLSHRDFSLELLTKCRDSKIGTAIETSMYRFDRELLSLCDIIMCDIKIWDSELHKKYVGISNREILDNIRAADSLGIPMIIRTPIVPGINDTAENVKNTADFIKTLKNVQKYELLPYHPLGISKARAQGLEMQSFETPTKEKMEELRKYADIR